MSWTFHSVFTRTLPPIQACPKCIYQEVPLRSSAPKSIPRGDEAMQTVLTDFPLGVEYVYLHPHLIIISLMTKTLYRSVPIFALSGGYVHNNVDINNGMIRLFLNFLHFRVTIFSFAFGFCSLGEVEKIMTHSSSFHGAKNVMNYCFHCRRIMIGVPYCVRRTICVPGLDYMS